MHAFQIADFWNYMYCWRRRASKMQALTNGTAADAGAAWKVPVVFWFSQALSGLSFLCSALVVFMLYEFPRLRATGHNRIIVSLATSNCLAAFFQLHFLRLSVRHLPWIGTRLDLCRVEAIGNQYFFVASFLCVGCLAYHINMTVRSAGGSQDPAKVDTSRIFIWMHLFVWSVPLAPVILLWHFDQFDSFSGGKVGELSPSGLAWCWIKPGLGQLTFYATLLGVIFWCCALTAMTIVYAKRRYGRLDPGGVHLRRYTWKVSVYVFVFIFARIWSIANRGVQLGLAAREDRGGESPYKPPSVEHADAMWFALYLMHSVGSSSQGLALALVFLHNESVYCMCREACSQWKERRKRRRVEAMAAQTESMTIAFARADAIATSSLS